MNAGPVISPGWNRHSQMVPRSRNFLFDRSRLLIRGRWTNVAARPFEARFIARPEFDARDGMWRGFGNSLASPVSVHFSTHSEIQRENADKGSTDSILTSLRIQAEFYQILPKLLTFAKLTRNSNRWSFFPPSLPLPKRTSPSLSLSLQTTRHLLLTYGQLLFLRLSSRNCIRP